MRLWQKLALAALVIALACVTVLSWGSLGSIITGCCLVMMVSALLMQKFVTNRDEDRFQSE